MLLLSLGLCACATGPSTGGGTDPAASTQTPAQADLLAPPGLLGEWVDDYGNRYAITEELWLQRPNARYQVLGWKSGGGYLVAQNHPDNPSDGSLYTRIDWMALEDMEPYRWAFCLSAYKEPSAAAAEASTAAKRESPKTGCNGFPFSRLKPWTEH